ncbi:hypothetical protein AB3S75_031785 [Citrus x aurantiifolia]
MATSKLLPLDIIVDLLIRLTSEESATVQVRSEVIPLGNRRPRFHQTPISIGSVETNSDRSLFLSVVNGIGKEGMTLQTWVRIHILNN